MNNRSRKLFSALLSCALIFGLFAGMPLTVSASEPSELAEQINSFNPHGSGALSATYYGNSVYVTGTVTDATIPLNLNIDAYATVYWRASYSGTVSDLQGLLRLSGVGTFIVEPDGIISNTGAGSAIAVIMGEPKVIISGGKVSATTGFAVYTLDPNITVTISGGEVSATSGAAVGINGPNSKVMISGGNVNATTGAAIAVNKTGVWVDIKGGSVNAVSGYAIGVNGANVSVTMSGGLLTSFGAAAIAVAGAGSTVDVTGGLIGAYGTAITGDGNVINMTNGGTPTIEGEAVVCAWNKPSGPPAYTVGSSTDLTVLPASASVVWDKNGSQNGVRYANNLNTGFLPIIGITLDAAAGAVPTITGPAAMTLAAGYAAASTDAYTVTGTPEPMVVKTGGNALVTWDNGEKKIKIKDGLVAGTYPVVLTASNSSGNATLTFTLTVTESAAPAVTAPAIAGPTALTLAEGYAATSTDVYIVTGAPAPKVEKTGGNAAITWNNDTKRLDIAAVLAAGIYPVVLTAANSGGSVTLTFTLTVTAPADVPAVTDTVATPFPFTDVFRGEWYYNDVKTAWESGLINGKTATLFAPDDNLTYAEAVKLASCMHQLYVSGSVALTVGVPNWYDSYVKYAKNNGIINKDYDWNAQATRAGYMEIFANALPEAALGEINVVPNGAVPDVLMTHPQAAAIYKLYRAGILQGVDAAHNCDPGSNIKRSEVAAILTRMMNVDARISFNM